MLTSKNQAGKKNKCKNSLQHSPIRLFSRREPGRHVISHKTKCVASAAGQRRPALACRRGGVFYRLGRCRFRIIALGCLSAAAQSFAALFFRGAARIPDRVIKFGYGIISHAFMLGSLSWDVPSRRKIGIHPRGLYNLWCCFSVELGPPEI